MREDGEESMGGHEGKEIIEIKLTSYILVETFWLLWLISSESIFFPPNSKSGC